MLIHSTAEGYCFTVLMKKAVCYCQNMAVFFTAIFYSVQVLQLQRVKYQVFKFCTQVQVKSRVM